jgi:hypothetical protein
MATLRLIKPHESAAPADGEPSATTPGRPETVSIRFGSLPAPLRAVVRDQRDGGLRIEAELPWLAVGTVVHGGPPGGVERTAQVSAFEVEVTSGGSARLVILTAPPTSAVPPSPTASPPPPRPSLRLRKVLLGALVIVTAAAAGYFLGQLSSPAIVLEPPSVVSGPPAGHPAQPSR